MLMDKQIERENVIRYKSSISDPKRFAALLEIQYHIKKKAMQQNKKQVSLPDGERENREQAMKAALEDLGLDYDE